MRYTRLLPALAAGALTVAAVGPAHAQTTEEEVPGVSTSTADLTVLGVDAGSLLSVDILRDTALANIDTTAGARSALAEIRALDIVSQAAGVSQSVPVARAESTGGSDDQSQELQPIDSPVLSATLLPVTLQAVVDEVQAASTLGAGVADVDVLSGIAALDAAQLGLGGTASGALGESLRGVDVDALTVLDLEALLTGLGIPLAELPLDTLLDLLDSLGLLPVLEDALAQLGIDVSDLSVDGIVSQVAALTSTLENVADTVGAGSVTELIAMADDGTLVDVLDSGDTGTTDDVATIIGDTTCTVLGTLSSCGGSTQSVEEILSGDIVNDVLAIVDQLDGLLNAPIDVLAGVSLVSLEGVDVNVLTKATDSIETSVAEVNGTLGNLTVGGLPLGELDLLATVDQLNAVLAEAESTISGALGTIDPSLSDMVDITTLQRSTDITQAANGAITSTASFTGVQVDVTPDLDALLAFVQSLPAVQSVGDQLNGLGLPVPEVGAIEMDTLNGLLAGVPTSGIFDDDAVFALSEGLSVEVASLSQSSTFTPGTAPTSAPPALPTTGSNDTLILLAGAALVAAALGARRLMAVRSN